MGPARPALAIFATHATTNPVAVSAETPRARRNCDRRIARSKERTRTARYMGGKRDTHLLAKGREGMERAWGDSNGRMDYGFGAAGLYFSGGLQSKLNNGTTVSAHSTWGCSKYRRRSPEKYCIRKGAYLLGKHYRAPIRESFRIGREEAASRNSKTPRMSAGN